MRVLLALLLCLPSLAAAQAPEFSLREADLAAHLRFLAADELMGRRAGTPGNDVAARYLAEQFRRAGAQPLESLGGYFQTIPFAFVRPPASAQFGAYGISYDQGEEMATLSGGAFSGEAETMFIGHGAEAADYANAAGKIVLAHIGTPGEPNVQTAFGASARKRALAAEAGAIALVECYNAPVPWANVAGFFNRERLTVQQESPSAMPHVWLDENAPCTEAESGALPVARLTTAGMQVAAVPSRNVIAVVPGTDPAVADEYIALTAHFDHVGAGMDRGAGASPADSIFNGARDNGMGTVALLAAADALARQPARRPVLLIAYTAEEDGLQGSAYFAEHPPVPLRQIKFALNVDTGGYSDTSTVMFVGAGRTGADALITQGAGAFGLTVLEDPIPGLFNRSDNVNLARKGVPAPTFSPGARSFSDPGVADFYHRPQDEADETFDFAYLLRFAQAFTHTARLLADTPQVPTWTPGDDYEAAGRALYGDE